MLHLDVRKLVQDTGGRSAVASKINDAGLSEPISPRGVEKWMERNTISVARAEEVLSILRIVDPKASVDSYIDYEVWDNLSLTEATTALQKLSGELARQERTLDMMREYERVISNYISTRKRIEGAS